MSILDWFKPKQPDNTALNLLTDRVAALEKGLVDMQAEHGRAIDELREARRTRSAHRPWTLMQRVAEEGARRHGQ